MVRVVFILTLLFGVANAQGDGTSTFPGLELPDPVAWLAATHAFVTGNGLHGDMERIGWALLFVGFLVGLSRIAYYASEAEWWAVLGRLLLGVLVLSNLSPLQGFVQNTWGSAYAWSSTLAGDTVEDDLVEGAEAFASLRVSDVMTPRADIVALEVSTPLDETLRRFVEVELTRLPLYRESLDDPVGVLHIKDVVRLIAPSPDARGPSWGSRVRRRPPARR